MSEHYCTYFDHRYVPKGLAMWRSLKERCPLAVLHVLCLNEATHQILADLELPDVHLIPLSELEQADPALLDTRIDRTLAEYYFTLTPSLPLYIFRTTPVVARLTYVDADLFFFADPQPVFDEAGSSSITLVEHRFPASLERLLKFGRFNVGWLTFRNDETAHPCLERWRRQCLDWCYDRVESDRFAEQKYLDDWPDVFTGVHIVEHPGANVAPWNLNRFELSAGEGGLRVGGDPLLFFHAHGFAPASPGRARGLNLDQYGVEPTPLLLREVFDPYEHALARATSEVASPLALALLADPARNAVTVVANLRAQLDASESDRAARLNLVKALQQRIDASDADRAARLDVIHDLQSQLAAVQLERSALAEAVRALQARLEASEADRAARLESIHAVQAQLAAVQVERAAFAESVQSLQARLDASEADRAARLESIHAIRAQLAAAETAQAVLIQTTQGLQARLEASEADRAERLEAIHTLQAQLAVAERERVVRLEQIETLHQRLAAADADAEALRSALVDLRAHAEQLQGSRFWRLNQPPRRR